MFETIMACAGIYIFFKWINAESYADIDLVDNFSSTITTHYDYTIVTITPNSTHIDINNIYVEAGNCGNEDIEIIKTEYDDFDKTLKLVLKLNDDVVISDVRVVKDNGLLHYTVLFDYDDGK